ncbi:MAG: glutamine amidotransferase, partial [Pseudomonadota bacterium]
MCGIAGRILNAPGQVGRDLVEMMDAQEHRGADSTGFAVYGPPREAGYVLRGMGFDKATLDADMAAFRDVLKAHGSDFVEEPSFVTDEAKHYCACMVVSDPDDIGRWIADADAHTPFEVQSCGRSLEIVKDVGGAEAVDAKHDVRSMIGTHGLGHARLATESSVLPNASHPFWARPFPDVAIVHNGQITDYFTWREKLIRAGYRFLTENDSELIAVWVSDRMKAG